MTKEEQEKNLEDSYYEFKLFMSYYLLGVVISVPLGLVISYFIRNYIS